MSDPIKPVDLSFPPCAPRNGRKSRSCFPTAIPSFVDTIDVSNEEEIVARHVFTEESFLPRTLPRIPVVPGVILCETMAQTGGAGLVKRGVLADDSLFFFASLDKVGNSAARCAPATKSAS